MKFPCIDHEQGGGKRGYGKWRISPTESMAIHRWVFWQTYGYLPPVVRHKCNNVRCINPLHLIGGTHADNMRDLSIAGHTSPDRKLSPEDILAIRESSLPARVLATHYTVSRNCIRNILSRKTYREV